MKYSNVISKLLYEPALVTPARHAALCLLMENRLARLSEPGIQPRIQSADSGVIEMDDESGDKEESKTVGKTIIIPVHGTIVRYPEDIAMSECGCDLDTLNEAIDAAEKDPDIEDVIFDFRTPGGSVTGVPETARKIYNMRKRTIAFTASECCSGGIWLAAQCKHFYATQSSRVGSVGVYTMGFDYTEMLKKDGVKVNAISAGKYKLLGAYWKPMGAEERAIMQKGVDKIYTQFKQAMETHREVSDNNFGNGLVFDGDEALAIGFIDGVVESMDDILDGMVE